MTALEPVETLHRHRHISDIDRHFAALVADFPGGEVPQVPLAAALASAHARAGHVCVALAEIAGSEWPREIAPSESAGPGVRLPGFAAWREELATSAVVAHLPSIGKGDAALVDAADPDQAGAETRPLVLDDAGRLYLARLWNREQAVAKSLLELAAKARAVPDGDRLPKVLSRLFGADPRNNRPRQAAEAALTRGLCCVSGGPGTGKTHAVAGMISALVELGLASFDSIALTAPTGKAAARLQEATRAALGKLPGKAGAAAEAVVTVNTVHRGLLQNEAERRLVKALVIDEVSMVDLRLMQQVLLALPAEARLILLGDAHQLSSVQPGSVFADVCAAAASQGSPLQPCFTPLQHNWRFDPDSGVGKLAVAVKEGNADQAMRALSPQEPQQEPPDIRLEALADNAAFDSLATEFADLHYAPMVERFRSGQGIDLTDDQSNPFRGFMTLCAHRAGGFGSRRFNELIEQALRARGLVPEDAEFYPGRPIIVTRNDSQTGLANGDSGIVVVDDQGARKVWFPELRDATGGAKLVAPSRLPAHESFFALTVHRSQGSEYDEVAVILGPERSRVNSRELLYTAVTRSRGKLVVYASEAALKAAIERKTQRWSGLQDATACA